MTWVCARIPMDSRLRGNDVGVGMTWVGEGMTWVGEGMTWVGEGMTSEVGG